MMNTGASAADPSATTLSTTPAAESSNIVDKFGHHDDNHSTNNNSNVNHHDDDMEACMVSATSRSSSQNNGLPRSTGGYDMDDEDGEGHDANAVAMVSSGGVASSSNGFFGNRSSKKLVALGALIVILAIIIGVSVGLSGNNNDGDDESNVGGGNTLKKDGDTDTSATAAAATTQPTSPAENPGSDRISDEDRRRNFDEIVSLVLPTLAEEPLLYPAASPGRTAEQRRRNIELSIRNPGSVQYEAINWMAETDPTPPGQQTTTTLIIERYALSVVFFSLADEGWENNWSIRPNTPSCAWNDGLQNGVLCDSTGRVSSLELADSNLQGPIPAEIVLLRQLKVINMQRNRITAPIPETVQNMQQLAHLKLQFNDIDGPTLETRVCNSSSLPFLTEFAADCGAGGTATASMMAGSSSSAVACSCCTLCCSNAGCFNN
eukprot:CAMPEP_0119552464 /NCGR_PEP_ID=MMETSP1352-20130426/5451_1 /TAXON_ID=265584 /ORGANISM="Stauroneis constricta, Strain CCMP1120" /LENGTH=433 /DNA_ID=CAMNT_0007598705 /DNA_START=193 /DNA_END=1494 /DNA_ORIENTATION=+